MNSRIKKYKRLNSLLICLAPLMILLMIYVMSKVNKDRILDQFSNNLYMYPLPSSTVVVEKTKSQAPNSALGWGNGDYWDVIATMKLSTKLSRDDIIKHYKNIVLPFPKNIKVIDGKGASIELFFEDEAEIYKVGEVLYYERKGPYASKEKSMETTDDNLIYILQIRSAY